MASKAFAVVVASANVPAVQFKARWHEQCKTHCRQQQNNDLQLDNNWVVSEQSG